MIKITGSIFGDDKVVIECSNPDTCAFIQSRLLGYFDMMHQKKEGCPDNCVYIVTSNNKDMSSNNVEDFICNVVVKN